MPEVVPRLIIFTDLDGTLLDHHTYRFDAAEPLLIKLREWKIPVIANTSKTHAEWQELAERLENHDPYVVENGSAMYFPDGECVRFGETRERILEILRELRGRYQFEGYADWDIAQIVTHTGLDRQAAARSAQRDFSEPLIWLDRAEKKTEFCDELEAQGLSTLQGGRFLHVLGQTDKGRAVEFLRSRLAEETQIIALGDSPNDIAMLQAADIGIVIQSANGQRLEFKSPHQIIHSTLQGPEGWAETLTPFLEKQSI